jgi:lysozyme
MRISEKGLGLIKRYEGLRLEAYRCPASILTIGYGHTGPDVKEGQIITPGEAERLLLADVARFERGVEALASPCNENQFSALVSFAFNLGLGTLQKSTLLKKHKAGDYEAAARQFASWNKARVHGQLVPLAGLTARREAEKMLYLGELTC